MSFFPATRLMRNGGFAAGILLRPEPRPSRRSVRPADLHSHKAASFLSQGEGAVPECGPCLGTLLRGAPLRACGTQKPAKAFSLLQSRNIRAGRLLPMRGFLRGGIALPPRPGLAEAGRSSDAPFGMFRYSAAKSYCPNLSSTAHMVMAIMPERKATRSAGRDSSDSVPSSR